LKHELGLMTRIVDIDPRTLKPRSIDPKNKEVFTKPKKFDMAALH